MPPEEDSLQKRTDGEFGPSRTLVSAARRKRKHDAEEQFTEEEKLEEQKRMKVAKKKAAKDQRQAWEVFLQGYKDRLDGSIVANKHIFDKMQKII